MDRRQTLATRQAQQLRQGQHETVSAWIAADANYPQERRLAEMHPGRHRRREACRMMPYGTSRSHPVRAQRFGASLHPLQFLLQWIAVTAGNTARTNQF